MRIDLSMVLAVFFLMGVILADVSILSTPGSGAGGPAAVGKTVNQDVIQPKQQVRSAEALHFRNPRDGYEMILIPGGEAIFGTGPDDPNFEESFTDKEKPQFRADIPEFYMGIYCVTNEQSP